MIDPKNPDYTNTPASPTRSSWDWRLAGADLAPVVSIVTPYYNAGAVFYETAQSVFRQSLQQWEWLIVNDGSSAPEALRILEEYRHKEPRIRVIDHPHNQGLSAARNTGFREARAEFVFQLDADDLIEPTTLEKMAWHLTTHPEFAFTTGFTVGFGSMQYLWRNGFHADKAFLEENLVTATCLVRKSVHQAIGGYEAQNRGGLEDWDFWLKAAAHGYWGSTIREFFDWYRRRDAGREHWDNVTVKEKTGKFRARLRQRYPVLWERGLPQIVVTRPQFASILSRPLPFTNALTKERPRLLFLVPHFELGGADKFNLDLIRQLQRDHGYQITVVATRRSANPWLHEFESLTPDVFVLHNFLHPCDFPLFLRYLIGSRRPDAVCISNSFLGYQILPCLRAHFPELPFVDYLHMEQEEWMAGGYPRYSLHQRRQLTRTVVSSQHLKDWMVSRGGEPNAIDVCYTNIDTEHWRRDRFDAAGIARKWEVDRSRPVILYAGRICDQKQPRVFAQVIRQVARAHPSFTVLVAGDGPDLPWLKEFAQQERLPQIRFLGAVANQDIAELLCVTDIFFLPSHWEGISLALYEAMAMEVVPVSGAVGGQAELVTGGCGVLVQRGAGEIANYTNALIKLLRFPEQRARMAAAARQRVVQKFPISELGHRLHGIFSTACQDVADSTKRAVLPLDLADLHASTVVEQNRATDYADLIHRERSQWMLFVQHSVFWRSCSRAGRVLADLKQNQAAVQMFLDGVKGAVESRRPDVELSARLEIGKALIPLDPTAAREVLSVGRTLATGPSQSETLDEIERALRQIPVKPPVTLSESIPTVSVVIPCYKQAHFLTDAVASVVGQTFVDWELIIVNDGSPDNTGAVANGLIQQYPQRKLRLIEQPNSGLSAARNAGIRAGRGKYILPLDADDRLQPSFLEKLVPILDTKPKVGFAYTHIKHFGAVDTEFPLPDFDRETLIGKDNIACVCSLFRRSAWEQVGGYNEAMREGYEDWDFWIGCVGEGWDGYCLHEPLFLYRKNGRSMLADANQKRERLIARIVLNHPRLYDEKRTDWARNVLNQHPATAVLASSNSSSGPVSTAGRPPLRITYLIGSILGVTGGNQTLLRQAEEMRRRGHDVTIVTYTPKPKWFNFETRVVQVSPGQRMASAVPPSDVVVATYFSNVPELGSVKAPVKIYYAQGDQFVFGDETMADTQQNRQLRDLSRASYLLPGIKFVPNSHNLARAVETLCGRRPDAILPVCTDQTIFHPVDQPPVSAGFRLLIVGPDTRGSHVEPLLFKGIQDIRDALQILSERQQQFLAVRMSGTPPEIFKHFPCEFHIAPTDQAKTVLFGTSHIHIYASHYDSCPRPPQEAMAAGCAVVCTATSGAMEYCVHDENCLLVPIKSPEAIADAVQRLMQDAALRQRLVQGGLATARQFPREREWNEWEAILYRFIEEGTIKDGQPLRSSQSRHVTASAAAPPAKIPACVLSGDLSPARESLARKNFPEAWSLVLKALHSRPFHPEAYLVLAQIALAAGDAASARRYGLRARELAPGLDIPKKLLKTTTGRSVKHAWMIAPAELQGQSAIPQTLTVCVITKNEEQSLKQCLASVQALAKQIVVLDTGSTDRTVEIAKSCGAEVHHFEWCDDFSAARNAALEHARGDWVLILDADEELPPDQHAQLSADLKKSKQIALRLPLVNRGQEAEGRSFVPRLFRNAPGVYFAGLIHEQVFPSLVALGKTWGLGTELGTAQILHHGYTKEAVKGRGKIERNLRLLRQAVEECPDDANLAMNLGLELVRSGDLDGGLPRYRHAFELMAAKPTDAVAPELREALLTQFSCHLYKARAHQEVVEVLTSPLAKSGGLTASLHFALGLAYFEMGHYAESAAQMRQCLARRGQPGLSPINTDILTAAPYHCLALSLAKSGNAAAAEQAFGDGLKEKACGSELKLDYAKFLVGQNRPVDALHRLHELVCEAPTLDAAWRLGGQIALARPEFLEVAVDWTGEALKRFPADNEIANQRAEALFFSQQTALAGELWKTVWEKEASPHALAALIFCEIVEDIPSVRTAAYEEEIGPTSRAFIEWYRRCLDTRAQGIVGRLNQRTSQLRSVLPAAARMIEAALEEAGEPATPVPEPCLA